MVSFMICAVLLTTEVVATEEYIIRGGGGELSWVYKAWSERFTELTSIDFNIDGGTYISELKARKIDFTTTTLPLPPEELKKEGLLQFPILVQGGVGPVINLEPAPLKLTREVLVRIYLGYITKWNDPAIAKLNPEREFPDLDITHLLPLGPSENTEILTRYLSEVSEEWNERVGFGQVVQWPAGVYGDCCDGGDQPELIPGSLIDWRRYPSPFIMLQNRAGNFVPPNAETFAAAAASAPWNPEQGFYQYLINQPGEQSWPMVEVGFILLHKEQYDAEKARDMLTFFDWCFSKEGDEIARENHYVPLPDNLKPLVRKSWQAVTVNGQHVWEGANLW